MLVQQIQPAYPLRAIITQLQKRWYFSALHSGFFFHRVNPVISVIQAFTLVIELPNHSFLFFKGFLVVEKRHDLLVAVLLDLE